MMRNFSVTEIVLILMALGVFLLPTIFYLLSLQKCLSRCSLENRAMSPGLVWLMMIPIFNLVWHFFVVINIAKSLRSEFAKRGIASEPNPGQGLGLALCILQVCSIIPFVGVIAFVATLVLWIIYWVKIVGYSSQLATTYAPANPTVRHYHVSTPAEQMLNCPICDRPIIASKVVVGRNICPKCGGAFDAE